jgi:nicotinamidase-related amidase
MDAMPPRSLLEIAGVVRRPPSFDESVLVIIDHQMEYRRGNLPLHEIEDAIGENRTILGAMRRASAPVIHIVTYSRPGAAIFEPSGPLSAIIPELAPQPDEPVVVKTAPSSFARTDLAQRIRQTGRRSLVVTGFMTHMCVSTTVRAALDFGFECTVIAAATATRDLPDPLGGIVPAPIVQRAALAELADRFALVLPDAAAFIAGASHLSAAPARQ